MRSILVLRSFGDYIIMLSCLKKKHINHIYIYASEHLEALHKSLNYSFDEKLHFEFIDFEIDNGIFPFFTNKYFLTYSNIKSVLKLKKFVKSINHHDLILEQDKRLKFLNLLICKKSSYIHLNSINNIYDSYCTFFDSNINNETDLSNINSIVIFPDSRKCEKIIKNEIINKLIKNIKIKNVVIAKFANDCDAINTICYNDFEKLIKIIENADLIISSDSLPLHLSQFFNKFHFALYNNKINHEWTTPISRLNKTNYLTNDIEKLTNHINSYLC